MNDPLLRRAFLLLIVIGMLHSAAAALYIYWSVGWFDLLMHFLGGFWIGLVSAWIYNWPEVQERVKGGRQALFTFVAALAIGLAWEAFEGAAGLTFVEREGYITDTLSDLAMDLVGAYVAMLYSMRLARKKHE